VTTWPVQEVGNFLASAGMPVGRLTEFVAIAICESSLDDQAVSPTGAIGLWQIEPYTATAVGMTAAQMYDPNLNALAAVRVSGHGANCAAWDTAYANIYRSGRYTFLNWPEAGSCAASHLSGTSVVLGSHNTGGGAAPAYPGVAGTIVHTVQVMGILAHQNMPGYGRGVRAWTSAATRLYTG
jgi:hypothetical protein